MEINPPITNRSTEELLEIIETPEHWQPVVVVSAQKELTQRGISADSLELRRKTRSKFQRKIEAIKTRSSYTAIEKSLIVLFGPILVLFLSDLFLFHAGEGYKKKNRQGFLFLFLGFIVWIVTLFLIFN